MQSSKHSSELTGSGGWLATILFGAIASLTAWCCSGCLQPRSAIESGYRISENSGAPMLVPNSVLSSDQGRFQTETVILAAGTRESKEPAGCQIRGEVFSLHLGSPPDGRYWIVRSPSVLGWNAFGFDTDLDEQWKGFIRDLVRTKENGCFPSGLSALSIRSAVAQRIPLPANEVPEFLYSDQGENFVDLSPGMEIRIQGVQSGGKSASSGSTVALRMSAAAYEVLSRPGGGVQLKLSSGGPGKGKGHIGSQANESFSLPRQFIRARALRLLLEGFSGSNPESNAILIGAAHEKQLEVATARINRRDPATCIGEPGVICFQFPPGSVSLLSTIWINGRRTSCPFGAPLSHLLFSIPFPEQSEALESIRIMRRVNFAHYAPIQIPRTLDGAAQLLLLPGDRIQWKH